MTRSIYSLSYHSDNFTVGGRCAFRMTGGDHVIGELKLIDGLNGLDLEAWFERWGEDTALGFKYRFVQPMSFDGAEDRDSLRRCLQFLQRHPTWLLGRQDHHHWSVP